MGKIIAVPHFNSIKVRLKRRWWCSLSPSQFDFNSIKVRLKQRKVCYIPMITTFQFHKGTIKTGILVRGQPLFLKHFNSIKVRLKHHLFVSSKRLVLHFNSIKVRLKRQGRRRAWAVSLFQFHKGTIKTLHNPCMESKVHHFNSIKVRLKQISWFFINLLYWFQFHKGTIKTTQSWYALSNSRISIP